MTTVGSTPRQRPAHIPAAQPYADLRETHSATVLLLGDRALKLKKPVDLGFLDFRTREQRLEACRREVELNRRIAPDVYLGVSDLVGPDGAPVDHLVTMRRLPDDRRLATLVSTADPGVLEALREVARTVAAFHATADRSPAITVAGGRDALAGRWEANLARLAPFEGRLVGTAAVARVRASVALFLADREALFASRQADGDVVDGHGDLLADDIFCLPDGPRIIDCLDFDADLRHVDVLDDVACLAMDLERLGDPVAATRFVDDYREFSGDPAPGHLMHHYVAYRATVRALVACIRDDQAGTTTSEPQELLDLAEHHLRQGEVRLVLVGGPPGSGKSTLAAALAARLGTFLIGSDPLRKELAGVTPETSLAAPFSQGPYAPGRSAATYEEMLRRAELLLGRGESVVLDATWSYPGFRAAAGELAGRTSSTLTQLHCVLAEDALARRVAARTSTVSDADTEIALRLARRFPAWPGAVLVDTSRSPEECVDLAVAGVVGQTHTARARFPRPRITPG